MWVFTVSYRTVCVNTTTGSELRYHLHGMSVDTIWHKHRIEIWYCPGFYEGVCHVQVQNGNKTVKKLIRQLH